MLIERKIQFTQGNSKIAIILNNTHRIFWQAHGRNFTRACISYGNAYPINARNSIFRNFYDSNATQVRFVIIFLACVLLRYIIKYIIIVYMYDWTSLSVTSSSPVTHQLRVCCHFCTLSVYQDFQVRLP